MDQQRGIPGLRTFDHWFDVPLDHEDREGARIKVFAREVVARSQESKKLPYLVFFQGGPGFGSPRPTGNSGWLKRALKDYRVVLLDQRGTGNSTPVCRQTLRMLGDPQRQADYLQHFRADSIVRDAELIRGQLCGGRPWTALGQSYGGWCISTYLSFFSEGLAAVLLTGGLPGIMQTADEIYETTFPLVEKKNERFYARYPEDRELIKRIVQFVNEQDVRLPQGDRLTPLRVQQLGLGFYQSTGFETLHYLLENAFVEGPNGLELSYRFLLELEAATPFNAHPIFSVLHEAIYAQGSATNWAAQRARGQYPQFDDYQRDEILLTGEMIFPWMFDEYQMLQPFKQVAEMLAEKSDWPPLYDIEQLRRNQVPCSAMVYYEDMCVARKFSEQTAELIQGTKIWVTNEYEHDGLRVDGERILDRLLEMNSGEVGFAY